MGDVPFGLNFFKSFSNGVDHFINANFGPKGTSPTIPPTAVGVKKTRVIALLYGVKISVVGSFVSL